MGQCLNDRCRVASFNDIPVKEQKRPQLPGVPKYVSDRRTQGALARSRQSTNPQHPLLIPCIVRPVYNEFQDTFPGTGKTLGAPRRIHFGGLQLIKDILVAYIRSRKTSAKDFVPDVVSLTNV